MINMVLTILALLLSVLVLQGVFLKETELQKATFAGGCFWCMEAPFEKIDGVLEVVSGYTGGHKKNPTYEEVCSGTTGHLEAVEVTFDQLRITYKELLDVFWRQIDPTDPGGQFVDRGSTYTTAIFYHNKEQKRLAEESKKALEQSGFFDKPIVTTIQPAGSFYRAEEYHQDFYKKEPERYKAYRLVSGRDRFLNKVWGKENELFPKGQKGSYKKPSEEEIKKKLTSMQYKVTQKNGTEPPFQNEYWENKNEGIYVDVLTGEPLFCSLDKFDSGTGWPSFTKPLEPSNIVEKDDLGFFMVRTEVRSKHGDSHLGHVFGDGPAPTFKRYCINSASLRFIPKDYLEREGYSQYLNLLEQ